MCSASPPPTLAPPTLTLQLAPASSQRLMQRPSIGVSGEHAPPLKTVYTPYSVNVRSQLGVYDVSVFARAQSAQLLRSEGRCALAVCCPRQSSGTGGVHSTIMHDEESLWHYAHPHLQLPFLEQLSANLTFSTRSARPVHLLRRVRRGSIRRSWCWCDARPTRGTRPALAAVGEIGPPRGAARASRHPRHLRQAPAPFEKKQLDRQFCAS